MRQSIHRSVGPALLLAAALLAPKAASAQWQHHQYNSGNYGNMSQTQYQHQQGIHVERPGAAIVGGLLSGIGQGLNAQNPQQNAVAAGVLGGLGQGFTIASQPTIWQQGSIQHTDQGYYNQNSGTIFGRRPGAPRPPQRRPLGNW